MSVRHLKGGASLVAMVAVLVACASQLRHPRLERAQSEVQQAKTNPAVNQYAASSLAQAEDALARAEASIESGHSIETQHLAYMAERRAQIAVAKGRQDKAERATQQAESQLQSEAARARAQASSAQREAARAKARAARASSRNQATQSRLETLKEKLADLNPKQTDEGIVLTLGDVLFGFDESDLKPSAKPTLNELARFLKQHSDTQTVINGYTDSVGSKAYNQRLSQARAQSVASALEQRGVDSDRLTTRGHGESNPIATNDTEEGRTKNRRVEFVIKNAGA